VLARAGDMDTTSLNGTVAGWSGHDHEEFFALLR
jgi:hypothetical protein